MEQRHVGTVPALPERIDVMQHVDKGGTDELAGFGLHPAPEPLHWILRQRTGRPAELFEVGQADRLLTRGEA